MKFWQCNAAALWITVFSFFNSFPGDAGGQELIIDADDYKRLETFESHSLAKADAVFARREYRQAAAEYDAFVLQFPKSKATPYAIYRKARCLQQDNKRFEAIKAYQEILDYFPNAIHYAAAALYYTGECHSLNGDIKAALKAWAEMASDKDYRRHYLAATAINRLADNLVKLGKADEATAYYTQVAVDFRNSNSDEANSAIDKAKYYYVRTKPNEAGLRQLYEKVRTFERDPRQPDDTNYWNRVCAAVKASGRFDDKEKDAAKSYFSYWAATLDGKLSHDGFLLDVANLFLAVDGDAGKWAERVDRAYLKNHTEGDYDRVMEWMALYAGNRKKVSEYYARLDFARMSVAQVKALMYMAYGTLRDPELAMNTFRKLPFSKMQDPEKCELINWLVRFDAARAVECCAQLADRELAQMELLTIYKKTGNVEKGLPQADVVAKIGKYSKQAYWIKAGMLEGLRKYDEAILAYRAVDEPPQSLFHIVGCLLASGKRSEALAQLDEMESFFPDLAPGIAMRKAQVWRAAKDEKMYVAALRAVMKKYPKSGESSAAHQELQRLGVKIGGAVDAE